MFPIQKRNVVTSVLLSIVTCGIYGIIWLIRLMKDAVSVKDPNDSGVTEIILALLLPFVGFYLAEKKFAEGCQLRGIPHKDNSVLYLVLGLVGLGIADYALMQNDLNSLVDMGYAYDPAPQQQPQYQTPQQPQYQAPQQPQYQAPQQPQYQAPQQPQYQAPQQPQYQAPQQPQYEAPQQPQYEAPQEPQFDVAPQQSQYEAPEQQ